MSKQYSIAHARANLPTIVDEVEAGSEVELTRRGRPVAIVISRQRYARLQAARPRFGDRYRAFLERFQLEDIGADDLEGLRQPGVGRAVDL
jgi:prevent-host-death family protein